VGHLWTSFVLDSARRYERLGGVSSVHPWRFDSASTSHPYGPNGAGKPGKGVRLPCELAIGNEQDAAVQALDRVIRLQAARIAMRAGEA
jgi:hypothetical protein